MPKDAVVIQNRGPQGAVRVAHAPPLPQGRGSAPPLQRRSESQSAAGSALLLTLVTLSLGGCGDPSADPASLTPERSRVAVVRERSGAARLDGIGPIVGFARGRDNTFVHSLEIALDALGRRIGYVELMGLSGMAFRTQVRVDRWEPGNPDPLVGEDCVAPLMAAIGVRYEVRVVRREDDSAVDALRKAVVASIDRGHPVLAVNIIPPEDWGLIVGYQREGMTWLCRSYHGSAQTVDRIASGWPTGAVFITALTPRPEVKGERVRSIRRAVELFDRRYAGRHAQGAEAFDRWCRMLETASDRRYLHPNAWAYVSLVDARRTAAPYLRMIAPQLGARGPHLLRAADLYEQEYRLLLSGLSDVPSADDFPTGLPPREVRQRQVNTLTRAKALEAQAVDALRKAL